MATNQGSNQSKHGASELVLCHPTPNERIKIWTSTFELWSDSLTLTEYLKESQFLTTVPLARKDGLTIWILVDKHAAPDEREIYSSCESFRKRSLTSDSKGHIDENIIHGIASVFCHPKHRGRGYPQTMMLALAKKLRTWQTEGTKCVGSILYSDIGKKYYTKLGWRPVDSNVHVEIPPVAIDRPSAADPILQIDLETLCQRDEALLRDTMRVPSTTTDLRMAVVPDADHMGWHLAKEQYACQYLFGKVPTCKGAITGRPGDQVWAIWAHRYYGRHDGESTNNVLYILRLVMQADATATRLPEDASKTLSREKFQENLANLKTVIQAAQAEAAEWNLDVVKLWDPSPLVREMLKQMSIPYEIVKREEESLASLMWYEKVDDTSDEAPLWINNEHYAWL